MRAFDLIVLRNVGDISHQTCKRLQALTLERMVWTAAYRNSCDFLPLGPKPSQTASYLEHILVRAQRWDNLWRNANGQNRLGVEALSMAWSLPSGVKDNQQMEIAHSRFLYVGGRSTMRVYDLQTRREIFAYQTANGEKLQWMEFYRSGTVESDGELNFYIPFLKNKMLIFAKLSGEGDVEMIDTNVSLDVTANGTIISIGYDVCLITRGGDFVSLFHIPSQKMYTMSSTLITENGWVQPPVLPGYVLLSEMGDDGLTVIELFAIPDHTTVPAGSPVKRTHSGIFPGVILDHPLFLSSELSNRGGTGDMWMVAFMDDRANPGPRPFCITLKANGELDFYLLQIPEDHFAVAFPHSPIYTVIRGSRARGAARTSIFSGMIMSPDELEEDGEDRSGPLALYDIYKGSDGDMHIDTLCVECPSSSEDAMHDFVFDPFVGFVIWVDGIIQLWDLLA
ncbi:hypothetical protein D9757_006710 [Collybiopsis confluens]|uniref:Uncharacterized protein n=1 Tax=Collybiopsis confluens TaxID=2823264 RepID=A0A8H5HMU8_9AGAR|nr:hypothetical protein D9757_006710 [Collybiopsis confluens]